MIALRKITLLIGAFTTVTLAPASTIAQLPPVRFPNFDYCAPPIGVRLLTKPRLDQIARANNIPLSRVGLEFERFALNTIIPEQAIPPNRMLFASGARAMAANIRSVVPDGVRTLEVDGLEYPVFYEAKALRRSTLPLSYARYQILGFLDALEQSNAGQNKQDRAIPTLVLLTTDEPRPTMATVMEATRRGVGLLQSIACEAPQLGIGAGITDENNPAVIFTPAGVWNPALYDNQGASQPSVGPGRVDQIFRSFF